MRWVVSVRENQKEERELSEGGGHDGGEDEVEQMEESLVNQNLEEEGEGEATGILVEDEAAGVVVEVVTTTAHHGQENRLQMKKISTKNQVEWVETLVEGGEAGEKNVDLEKEVDVAVSQESLVTEIPVVEVPNRQRFPLS